MLRWDELRVPIERMTELVAQLTVRTPEVVPHRRSGDEVAEHHLIPGEYLERARFVKQPGESIEANLGGDEQDDEAEKDRGLALREVYDERRQQPDEHERGEMEDGVDENESQRAVGRVIGAEDGEQAMAERCWRTEWLARSGVD